MDSVTFGIYLHEKRKAAGITQTDLASVIKKSGMYISNIEKGKNLSPPQQTDLNTIADELHLMGDDRILFFELAAADRATLPAEQIRYINSCGALRALIREGMKRQITDSRWEQVLNNFTGGTDKCLTRD